MKKNPGDTPSATLKNKPLKTGGGGGPPALEPPLKAACTFRHLFLRRVFGSHLPVLQNMYLCHSMRLHVKYMICKV